MSFLSLSSSRRLRLLALSAVGLLGFAVSLATWRLTRQLETIRALTEFQRRAETLASLSRARLQLYEEMLLSLREIFLGSDDVNRDEFHRVAAHFLQRHPGIQALEWVPLVRHADRVPREEQAARELGRQFQFRERDDAGGFRPAPVRPEYLPILYAEPLTGNEPVLGYDITTAPTREHLAASRANREPVLTTPFQLAQITATEPGIVFALPVFWSGNGVRDEFRGFVQGVFLVRTMLLQALPRNPETTLDIIYTDPAAGGTLLLWNRDPAAGANPAILPPAGTEDCYRTLLRFGNREWHLRIQMTPEWRHEQHTLLPWLILAGGLIITALGVGSLRAFLQRSEHIEQEVAERTAELRTAQQLLEEDIARRTEAEARLQAILDNSPAAIFVKDIDGRYVIANQPFAAICQRARADILGRTDYELFPPAQAAAIRANDGQALAAGRPMEFEETIESRPGPRTHIVQKFPLHDATGRVYALGGILTDITDRLQAESQRLAMERRLFESQKLESLGVLAGGIAHDFNNLLTAILGNSNLVRLGLTETHPLTSNLAQVETAARRAADLCQQMLAYAGKSQFVTSRVDLSALVRSTTALIGVSIGKNTQLELRLAESLPPIVADATQLRQIVMNLVINASDAIGPTQPGRIDIATYGLDCEVSDLLRAVGRPELPAGAYIGLEVRDNGGGMSPETQTRGFEPFFTTKFAGRGLGLSAVLGIVQSHRGALFVESAVGQGSCFRLLFPAAPGSAAPFSKHPFPAAGLGLPGPPRTVLLVDDEEPVRLLAAAALRQARCQVLEAADGEAALRICETHPGTIDLVLLDLVLPRLSGEETLERLRRLKPTLPVIIMSGYNDPAKREHCARLGAPVFIQKPFDLATLFAKIQAAILA